jgi:hypothetical protein
MAETIMEFWNEPRSFGSEDQFIAMLVVNNQNQSLTLHDVELDFPRSTFNVTYNRHEVGANESAEIGVPVYPVDLQAPREGRVERCAMTATLNNKSFATDYAAVKLARNEQLYYLLSPAYQY